MSSVSEGGPIVDAHLDLAYNVLAGADVCGSVDDLRSRAPKGSNKCMVTLPELQRGGVSVVFATLFTGATVYDDDGLGVYEEPPEQTARRQLDVYLGWESEGLVRIIRDRAGLDAHLESWRADGKLGLVVLIEGGDSITSPDELPPWWEEGVRVIGPAWGATRYCGGTRRPGGLTPIGRELVMAMRELGFVLDASHLAEQSFWEAIDIGPGKVIASHSNARTLVGGGTIITGDRQLSDEMIKAIGSLDGVIGLNLFNGFLVPEWEAVIVGKLLPHVFGGPPPVETDLNFVTLEAVRAHAEHIAALVGWQRVGIGSDLDGGFGEDSTPVELRTAADLRRIADVVPPEARAGVLGENWLRFLAGALPAKTGGS